MTNIPIFLSSDNNYAPFVATTMASILDNTQSFIEFYILDGGITKDNQKKICELKKQFNNFSIEFLKIDYDKYFKDFGTTGYITKAMYSRFLIPDLKPEIDRALYSDVDVIFMDDAKKMYDEPLEGFIIGAVSVGENIQSTVYASQMKNLEISNQHKYFASGNLLIDCKKWRENNITSKLFEITYKYNEKLRTHDMDVLNKCFDRNYKILSPKYCCFNQNYKMTIDLKEAIVVRHFNGKIKPWDISSDIDTSVLKDKDEFWKYARMTSFYSDLIERLKTIDQKEIIRKEQIYNMIAKRIKGIK